MTARTRATRAGFTMIEVLMVIAIIAILASLLFVGISRASGTAKIVQARNDITQLDTVLTKFKQDFGFYPPSHVTTTAGPVRFMVPTNLLTGGSSLAAQQNDQSFTVLQRMFPRWQPVDSANSTTGGGTITGIFNSPTFGALPGAGQSLDPNQSLVYFLNGPTVSNPGWDVAKPYSPTGTTKKGPFFDFPASRLNASVQFLDSWGTPYAYFSSNGDRYDAQASFPWQNDPQPAAYDPSADTVGIAHPYRSGSKWINPSKCQLISAGPNRQFGPGLAYTTPGGVLTVVEVWNAKNPQSGAGSSYYGEKTVGEDDLANFNEGGALGVSAAP